MFVESVNFKLKLEDFQKDWAIPDNCSPFERKVFHLIHEWFTGGTTFSFTTSGSTGAPKKIVITRDQIKVSARATFDFIDKKNEIKHSLLCLDPSFIGGAMVVFRALIYKTDLFILEPSNAIFESLPKKFESDLVSLVPMQFHQLSAPQIRRFRHILIGGAPMKVFKASYPPTRIYSTFGMTETVSHIAIREIDQELFTTVGDIEVALESDQSLKFRGTLTNHHWIKTNDIGYVFSSGSFQWLGRKDFIINSGGIKINPEHVEQRLYSSIKSPFMITSIPDKKFQNRLVLILEGANEDMDFSSLNKYERPKQVFYNQKIVRTESGKVDRLATQNLLIATLNEH